MIKKEKMLLNEDIRVSPVRCVGDNGEQYGIIEITEAQAIAREMGLDLVLVAQSATPPVCKIMDYGKFKYQQEKKLKEAKKKQKIIEVKEIKLSIKIAQNDINYKVRRAIEFLNEGKYVKFKVVLRGREMAEPSAAFKVLDKIYEMIQEYGRLDKKPAGEGGFVAMTIAPKKAEQKSNTKDKDAKNENS